jgi:non-ribosomal peptide synthetase component F
MQAGGAYLPLDPDIPNDRLSIYLEDASAEVLVTSYELRQRAKDMAGPEPQWQVCALHICSLCFLLCFEAAQNT